MRTDYMHADELRHLLAALTPPNRLALEISLATGLRIGDVLSLRSEAVQSSPDGRLTVREQKTAKNRRVRLPRELHDRALAAAGRIWVFEGRQDYKSHRTRQAVWKDLRRAAKLFRVQGVIAPHTARKTWAVGQFRGSGGDLKRVQRLLQHESEAVTMLYAMADELTERRKPKKAKGGVNGAR